MADHCVDRDLPSPMRRDILLSVLDRSYALATMYVPTDLVAAEHRASGLQLRQFLEGEIHG